MSKLKLAFAHDHIFQKDKNGNLFTGGSFNNEVWKRYLEHFDTINVLARKENLKDKFKNKTYNSFDLPQTELKVIPSISGPIKQIKNKKEAESKIREVLKESDALIARLPSETGNLAIKIAKELKVPYAVEVVACVWDALWNHGSLLAKAYAPLALYKMKRKVKSSPYTLYVTNEFLQKRYPTYGIVTNVSNVEIRSIVENSRKKPQNHKLKIGMIGSLKNKIKGWDVAFAGLSKLKENGYDFEFEILGDGNPEVWEPLLRKQNLLENVSFKGVLPGGDPVVQWMDNIDIYIQPSYQEGLPRAVIEAMSRALPVVGSNAGGIPELIHKDFVHKKGSPEDFAIRLENLIDRNTYEIHSHKNLSNAQQYKKDILDQRRNEFWSQFKLSIKN